MPDVQDWKVERHLPNEAGAVITVVASGATEPQARGIAAAQEDPENIYLVPPGGKPIPYRVRERPSISMLGS